MLDIDMDFFLNDIAHGFMVRPGERLDGKEFYPWEETTFRRFLENQCLLSPVNRIKGRIIKDHHEAFFFWKELVEEGKITIPFEVTHVDAHSDTGTGDSGWVYIVKELNNFPIEERLQKLDFSRVNLVNYLSFAMSCGWVSNVDFILHPNWSNDLSWIHQKDCSDSSNSFQLKAFDPHIKTSILGDATKKEELRPSHVDPVIPYTLTEVDDFLPTKSFDYLVFCQSPGYTPQSADYMLEVIKDYVDLI